MWSVKRIVEKIREPPGGRKSLALCRLSFWVLIFKCDFFFIFLPQGFVFLLSSSWIIVCPPLSMTLTLYFRFCTRRNGCHFLSNVKYEISSFRCGRSGVHIMNHSSIFRLSTEHTRYGVLHRCEKIVSLYCTTFKAAPPLHSTCSTTLFKKTPSLTWNQQRPR